VNTPNIMSCLHPSLASTSTSLNQEVHYLMTGIMDHNVYPGSNHRQDL
jgi:hypothetical protein